MEANNTENGRVEEFDDRFRNYRSAAHHHSGERGHYWEKHDEEVPDYWLKARGDTVNTFYRPSVDTLPEEHQPDVPDDWDPSDYTAYHCKTCGDGCINPVNSPYAQHMECRRCNLVPAIEDVQEDTEAPQRADYSDYLDSQPGEFPHLP